MVVITLAGTTADAESAEGDSFESAAEEEPLSSSSMTLGEVLELVMFALSGNDAARLLATTCSSYREALSRDYVYNTFLAQEFPHATDCAGSPDNAFHRYVRAFLRGNAMRWRRIARGSEEPVARQGSAGCIMPNLAGGSFALFGGWTVQGMSRELNVLKPDGGPGATTFAYRWDSVVLRRDPAASATYGHTLTTIPASDIPGASANAWPEDVLFVYGGVTMGGYRGAVGEAHLMKVEHHEASGECRADWGLLEPQEGRHVTPEGRIQPGTERAYHTATVLSSRCKGAHPSNAAKVWLFGGFNDEERPMASLECLNLRTLTWEIPTPAGAGPADRFGHTCTVVGGKLMFVGGTSGSSNYKGQVDGRELKDVWVLDTTIPEAQLTWSHVHVLENPMYEPGSVTANASPEARRFGHRCHSSVVLNGSELLLFGGGPPGGTTNELHVMPLEGGEALPNGTTSVAWRNPSDNQVTGTRPRARQNHAVGVLGEMGGLMILYGGCLATNGSEELGDTWLLDLDHGYRVWTGEVDEALLEDEVEEDEEDEEDEEMMGDGGGGQMMVQLPGGQVVPAGVLLQYFQAQQMEDEYNHLLGLINGGQVDQYELSEEEEDAAEEDDEEEDKGGEAQE